MTDEPDIDIPFGHWGVFTSENFDIDGIDGEDGIPFIKKVPLKVWDNYHPIEVRENGRVYKLNKLTGRFTLNSYIRSKRVHETGSADILKGVIEGNSPSILISTESGAFKDNVFSRSVSNQKIENAGAATILNRFPAFVRLMDPDLELQVKHEVETNSKHLAKGVCLVSFPTQSYEHLREIPNKHLYSVLKSMRNAAVASVEAAHDANIHYMPTSLFINTDKDTGRSLNRFHIQMYIDMTQDGHDSLTEAKLQAFDYEQQENDGCHYCLRTGSLGSIHDGEFSKRLVYWNDNWMLWVSGAPIVSYHLKFAPTSHLIDISELDDNHIRDLADVLIVADKVLEQYNIKQGKHICINQRPFDYKSEFHLYGDVLPNDVVGGYEKMGDSRVDTKPPAEYIAAALREIVTSCTR